MTPTSEYHLSPICEQRILTDSLPDGKNRSPQLISPDKNSNAVCGQLPVNSTSSNSRKRAKQKDIWDPLRALSHLLDTSDLDVTHDFFNVDDEQLKQLLLSRRALHKKKLGTLGLENKGEPIMEFYALRAKNYHVKFASKTKTRCKGLSLRLLDVKTDVFRDLQRGKKLFVDYPQISIMRKPRNLVMQMRKFKKRSMTSLDMKNFLLPDFKNTLPHGHYMVPLYMDAYAVLNDIIDKIAA